MRVEDKPKPHSESEELLIHYASNYSPLKGFDRNASEQTLTQKQTNCPAMLLSKDSRSPELSPQTQSPSLVSEACKGVICARSSSKKTVGFGGLYTGLTWSKCPKLQGLVSLICA